MMTKVKDLKRMLEEFPDEMDIFIKDDRQSLHFRRLTLEKMDVNFPWLEKDQQQPIVSIVMID